MAADPTPSAEILVLFNSWGGRRNPDPALVETIETRIRAAGRRARIGLSADHAEGRRLMADARGQGVSELWIAGGDGTIHGVINEAAGEGFVFGVLPMGTVNAFAKAFGVPQRPADAVTWLLAARPRPVDLGRANGRLFGCFASVGLDASAVHGVSDESKARFGRVAYAIEGLRAAANAGMGGGPPRFMISFDEGGEPVEAHSMVTSLVENYAGLNLFPGARSCGGNLRVAVFRNPGPWAFGRWFAAGALGHAAGALGYATGSKGPAASALGSVPVSSAAPAAGDADPLLCQTRGFTIRCDTPVSLQLDGDATDGGNARELRFKCLPQAAHFLMEPSA